MALENCVYCGKKIENRSREHVIQNAIGGWYESTDICCGQCNNYISKYIDKPFTSTFNPIIGRIKNLARSRDSALPTFTGTAEYNGKTYPIEVKNGRISCPTLAKELRCDVSKLDLKVLSYDFNIDNNSFQNGINKIAFNYALDRGIDLSVLQHGLNVQKSGNDITGISINYPTLPFVPMNILDTGIELNAPVRLYHNMILFNQENLLWCYVDLFNTFQYYVLLSDNYKGDGIHQTYTQTFQKIDRTLPDFDLCSAKDLSVYAAQYNIDLHGISMDDLKKRIANEIRSKSQRRELASVIDAQIGGAFPNPFAVPHNELLNYFLMMSFYLDDKESLRTDRFRTLTPAPDGEHMMSYPVQVNTVLSGPKGTDLARAYATAKFNRLNNYLVNQK